MSEFIQGLLIISITIVAIVAIVYGKRFSAKADKNKDKVTAEIAISQDIDKKRKK